MGDELQGGAVSAGRSAVRAFRLPDNCRSLLAILATVIAIGGLGACTLPQGATQPATTAYNFQGTDFRTLIYSAATD